MKAEEFISKKAVSGSLAADDKQYLEMGDVVRLLDMVRQEEMSPIAIHGRKYVVEPYTGWAHIPKAIIDFVERHPERDDVKRQIENGVERLLLDIQEYLRDAMAVTAVGEDSGDPNVTAYRLELPVLMPADTRDRWQCDSEEEFLAYEKRLNEAVFDRKGYSYKIVELSEEEREDGV